jgi:hypothetical protein
MVKCKIIDQNISNGNYQPGERGLLSVGARMPPTAPLVPNAALNMI